MAKARHIPGIDGRRRFGDVGREAVAIRAQELFDHADGVLDTSDVERVHDMRVATRRLRTVLEVFAVAFDTKAHKAVLRDVKALADALGARRDPDVQLAELEELARVLAPEDQTGLEVFAQRLRAEQVQGNQALDAALKTMAEHDLAGRLRALTGSEAPIT
jgi:CHAD domain-containing protein